MSLWNFRKPLNQPPHFGRVGAQDPNVRQSAELREADRAITEARFRRELATLRQGGRRAVVVE